MTSTGGEWPPEPGSHPPGEPGAPGSHEEPGEPEAPTAARRARDPETGPGREPSRAGDPSSGDEFWGDGAPSDRRARGAARRAEQRRRRRRRGLVLAVLAVLVLPFLVVAGWFAWQLYEPGGEGAAVRVTVQPGWGAREIGDELSRKDVVGSSLVFQVWYRIQGATTRAGSYPLHEHMGVKDAVDALDRAPGGAAAGDHTVLALPPGLRLEQIADRVGKLPGHDRAAFLALAQSGQIKSKYQGEQQSVEGFTWPDTYFVEGMTDAQILQTIVSQFDRHADAVGLGTPAATGLTPQQTVVLASLVQAEAGTAADAPKVAAVVTNRLKQGMPLQIDATLCYAKGGCPPVPSNADKQLESPYNTYKVSGLPPTPIMTVTEQSLRAAREPANVPYLFYVTGKDGVTYYATTLAEHEANIRAHGVSGE